MAEWCGKWPGGRLFKQKNGGIGWFLDRSFNGKRYGMKLNVSSEDEAMAEWALWKRDPLAYTERREERLRIEEDRVLLTPETIDLFRNHLYSLDRERKHVENCCYYLVWWEERLRGKDLRKVTLRDLKLVLATAQTARKNRIAAYKVLASFLREELAVLPRGDDASLDLKIPAARAEKDVREKGHTAEEIQAVYANLSPWGVHASQDLQPIRDLIRVLITTGCHQTELMRIARGDCVVEELHHPEIAAVVRVRHKSGQVHQQSVDAATLAAVRRLISKGSIPAGDWTRRCVAKAAERAGVQPLRIGSLRHSFVTLAAQSGRMVLPKDGGLSLTDVARAVGHASPSTTKKFYDCSKVPAMIVLPLELEHPDDPIIPGQTVLRLVQNS